MSNKKNLLNEGQVRQFMKLARLEPLTPGFVHGLVERGSKAGDEGSVASGKKDDTDYSGEGERKGDESKTHAGKDLEESTEEELDETHGRGMNDPGYGQDNSSPGRRVKVSEGEAGPDELEDFAADDLADDSLEGDAEAVDDELEADAEMGDVSGDGGRTVSVDDFLAALETALESAMGDEVEVDASEMEDEAPEEDEFAPEGDEVVADMEVEDEMELEEAFSLGKSAADKAREKLALGKKGSYDPDPAAGEKDYTPTPEEIAKARADKSGTRSRDKFPRGHATGGGGGMKIGGITAEGQDELVEQITKRVAARILKSALTKK